MFQLDQMADVQFNQSAMALNGIALLSVSLFDWCILVYTKITIIERL